MANNIKTCPNGHKYDANTYGDNCPFCPSGHTHVIDNECSGTKPMDSADMGGTIPMQDEIGEPRTHTVIHHDNEAELANGRQLVGVLVSYSANKAGEVYKIYEGTTTIGKGNGCDIQFPQDSYMSKEHLLIQYIEAKGVFKAMDRGSSNGTYVNGKIYVLNETIDLQTNDVIVLGGTKLVFLAIPKF